MLIVERCSCIAPVCARKPVRHSTLSAQHSTPSAVLLALALFASQTLAHEPVTPRPKLLQKGIPLGQIAGEPGFGQVYQIVVPEGGARLTFTTRGGTGDCDLFLRHGAHPTTENFDAQSAQADTRETITVNAAEAGRWYLLVEPFTVFRGVQLTARYEVRPGTIRVPTLLPAPGVFAGKAAVRLKCASKDATLRFTTDGAPVTAASSPYLEPLVFTGDTHLRVKAFGAGDVMSEEVEADYLIVPDGTITPLGNARPVFHRGGAAGSEHLFAITVLPGQKFLRLRTEGGAGDTELFYRHGLPPTRELHEARVNGRRNRASAEIATPVAGDWFILLRGRSNFSGVSLLASARPSQPDLIVWRDAIVPYIDEAEFSPEDCEVQEGTIEAGRHTLLRFDTQTRNVGGADLIVPSPVGNPDFEYQECHGHYHFKGFASYRLLDAQEQPVVLGRKVSFCLLDVQRWDLDAPRHSRFSCEEQGIQAGWADIYDGGLPGQWIDVTGMADGAYTLEVTLNPERKLFEADYTNNTERVPIELSSTPSGARAVQVRGQR